MRRVSAYIDESGAFGWDLSNPSVSTCFVITSIIVDETEEKNLMLEVEKVRKKYFQTGEMKSSKVGRNHKRRIAILKDLLSLPFTMYTAVFDKFGFLDSPGLKYRDSFYKFLNGIVHRELRRNFPYLTVKTDEIGTGSYMLSFSKYIQRRTDAISLLGEANFAFENSKDNVLIQLADFLAGTYACEFDINRRDSATPQYSSMLSIKNPFLERYPLSYTSFQIDSSKVSDDEDVEIAEICYKRAIDFILSNENSTDPAIVRQIIVLKYLLQQFMYAEKRGYVPAFELIEQLSETGHIAFTARALRSLIIGRLRDAGVIISGSSAKKGYKIPSRYQELIDYVNHDTAIILPMLIRLKKCRDAISMGTLNTQDLFETHQAKLLRNFLTSVMIYKDLLAY